MFFVQNSRTIFYSDNYQDIVDKLNEYYNTVLLFNEIDLKKFLNSYKIIESKNNVIIKEFNGSVLYDLFKNNKPKIKQTVINHKFNNMKPLIEKEEEDKNEYENMFNETSIIPSIVDLKNLSNDELAYYLNEKLQEIEVNKPITYKQSLELVKVLKSEKPNIALNVAGNQAIIFKSYGKLFIEKNDHVFSPVFVNEPCIVDNCFLFADLIKEGEKRFELFIN